MPKTEPNWADILSRTPFKTPQGRPIMQDSRGSAVTQRMMSVSAHDVGIGNIDQHALIPTVYGGKPVTGLEAIKLIRKNKGVDPDTGLKIQVFNSVPESTQAARAQSAGLGEIIKALMQLSNQE